MANELRNDIWKKIFFDELKFVCKRSYETWVVDRLEALKKIRKNLLLLNVRKCFEHWLRKTRRKKHQRKLLDDFPLYPGALYNSYVHEEGGGPPKKIRLSTYRDCPSLDCCKLAPAKGNMLHFLSHYKKKH